MVSDRFPTLADERRRLEWPCRGELITGITETNRRSFDCVDRFAINFAQDDRLLLHQCTVTFSLRQASRMGTRAWNQKENSAWKKILLEAELVGEEKMPLARL